MVNSGTEFVIVSFFLFFLIFFVVTVLHGNYIIDNHIN